MRQMRQASGVLSQYQPVVATSRDESCGICWREPESVVTLHQNQKQKKENCYEDNEESGAPTDRTVLVYLAGHNNLSSDLEKNVRQIKEGSKAISDGTLLVFVRTMQSGVIPWRSGRRREMAIRSGWKEQGVQADKRH